MLVAPNSDAELAALRLHMDTCSMSLIGGVLVFSSMIWGFTESYRESRSGDTRMHANAIALIFGKTHACLPVVC